MNERNTELTSFPFAFACCGDALVSDGKNPEKYGGEDRSLQVGFVGGRSLQQLVTKGDTCTVLAYRTNKLDSPYCLFRVKD